MSGTARVFTVAAVVVVLLIAGALAFLMTWDPAPPANAPINKEIPADRFPA